MNVGSLFAGIGGFDLGLERAGMHTAWQVELDPYCRAVLAQHFPGAERFEDVREVGAHNLAPVDLICGGFPCQDISLAGKGAGIDGARSGLWGEMWRVIRELGPRWVVVENVPALTSRGLDRVLRDLASGGYDAEWDCLPASAFGAPHRRDRIWLVAYPNGCGRPERQRARPGRQRSSGGGAVPDADARGLQISSEQDGQPRRGGEGGPRRDHPDGLRDALADPEGQPKRAGLRQSGTRGKRGRRPGDGRGTPRSESWATEPNVGRVADGVPARVDRLAALGNALIPQIAEWIGRRVLDFEEGGVA